jgi:phage internal scaffolding protein
MSRDFANAFGKKKVTKEEMRAWNTRPGTVDEEGKPKRITEQWHKDACDINKIVEKHGYERIVGLAKDIELDFGEFSGMDLKEMADIIRRSQEQFNELPPHIRKEFNNSPGELLDFMDNPDNRERAIELGLVKEDFVFKPEGTEGNIVNRAKEEPPPETPSTPPADPDPGGQPT